MMSGVADADGGTLRVERSCIKPDHSKHLEWRVGQLIVRWNRAPRSLKVDSCWQRVEKGTFSAPIRVLRVRSSVSSGFERREDSKMAIQAIIAIREEATSVESASSRVPRVVRKPAEGRSYRPFGIALGQGICLGQSLLHDST